MEFQKHTTMSRNADYYAYCSYNSCKHGVDYSDFVNVYTQQEKRNGYPACGWD